MALVEPRVNVEFHNYESATEFKLSSPKASSEIAKMRYWWQVGSRLLELIVSTDAGELTVILDGEIQYSERASSLFDFLWRSETLEIKGLGDRVTAFQNGTELNGGRTMVMENDHATLNIIPKKQSFNDVSYDHEAMVVATVRHDIIPGRTSFF